MKFETHLHTSEVSPCSIVPAKKTVQEYHRAGYDGIVVTDHLGPYSLDHFTGTAKEKIECFLNGYYLAKEEGERLGFTVLLGAEICLYGKPNEFLLYGLPPDFYLQHPTLYSAVLPELFSIVHEAGGLVVQAHPFREYCTIQDPAFMDGIEVFNGNPRHNSRNELAEGFARRHKLTVQTSGSDYHQLDDLGKGGMVFDRPVSNEKELVAALLSPGCELIKNVEA